MKVKPSQPTQFARIWRRRLFVGGCRTTSCSRQYRSLQRERSTKRPYAKRIVTNSPRRDHTASIPCERQRSFQAGKVQRASWVLHKPGQSRGGGLYNAKRSTLAARTRYGQDEA